MGRGGLELVLQNIERYPSPGEEGEIAVGAKSLAGGGGVSAGVSRIHSFEVNFLGGKERGDLIL